MNEPFLDQAATARDRYLTFLRRAIDGWKTEAVEVLVQPHGRTTPSPFCLCRIDAILGSADAPRLQRACDAITQAPESRFVLSGGIEVHQKSFSWEALRVEFSSREFAIEQLGTWLHRWLDPDETRSAGADGLSGVVHDLSWSFMEPDAWGLDLDLGSAPIDALSELLDVLSRGGVRSITLSRTDLGDA